MHRNFFFLQLDDIAAVAGLISPNVNKKDAVDASGEYLFCLFRVILWRI